MLGAFWGAFWSRYFLANSEGAQFWLRQQFSYPSVYNKYSVHFGTFGCQNEINSTSFFSTSFHCNALVCIEHITMAEVKLIFSKKPLLCLYQFGIYRKESVERSSEKKYSKMQYIQRNEMQRRTFYTEILQYKLIQCLQCNTKQCKEGG